METREINKEYVPQETTREKQSVDVKVFGGSYQVDRVIENSSGRVDHCFGKCRAGRLDLSLRLSGNFRYPAGRIFYHTVMRSRRKRKNGYIRAV